MAEPIKNWTIGSDANGDVQLNIYLDDKHYTLDVHEKDVKSMQTTVDIKALRQKNSITKDTQRVRVVMPISDHSGTIADVGEILTVERDYFRIGQPQVLRNHKGKRICDVDSYTAKIHCVPTE